MHIADAGVDAIRKGFTRYTAVEGIPDLKDAIIAKFKRDNRIEYTRPQILVSTGAKQTIYNHYGCKADLVAALSRRRTREMTDPLATPEASITRITSQRRSRTQRRATS